MGINNIVLNSFRVFRFQNRDVIKQNNLDASKKNHRNVQRIEFLECNTLFDELKSSTNS